MKTADIIISADKTKGLGLVYLCESGGRDARQGSAIIIARKDGKKPTALRFFDTPNKDHAIIPVYRNYIVINTSYELLPRPHFSHTIYCVANVNKAEVLVRMQQINKFENEQWENPLADYLKPAVKAAEKKALTRNCCRAMYAVIKNKK